MQTFTLKRYRAGVILIYALAAAALVVAAFYDLKIDIAVNNTDDGFSTAVFDRIIEARHAAGRPVIVVSCQLPYDAARFPDADAILLAYCASPMRVVPPRSGEGSAWAPNLPAALCACFGAGEAGGRLPVTLPALDEYYAFVTKG